METRNQSTTAFVTRLMWIGALAFFMIAECLIFWVARGPLRGLPPHRLWQLPLMVAMPLVTGAGFAAQIRRSSSAESERLAELALRGFALVESLPYSILTGVTCYFL